MSSEKLGAIRLSALRAGEDARKAARFVRRAEGTLRAWAEWNVVAREEVVRRRDRARTR